MPAALTFLQLAQQAAINCGISGSVTTCQNQSGEIGRIVQWVNDAWLDIQVEHDDWTFLRSSYLLGGGVTFVPGSGLGSGKNYTPLGTGAGTVGVAASSFGKWAKDSFRSYSTAAGFTSEAPMDEISFDVWRDSYMFGAMRNTTTRPVVIAFGPQQEVCIGPPSDGTWTIEGDYFYAPSQMSNDSDTPTYLPPQFCMLIVYRLMKLKHGLYEAAPEVIERGMKEHDRMMSELEAQRGAEIYVGGTLA